MRWWVLPRALACFAATRTVRAGAPTRRVDAAAFGALVAARVGVFDLGVAYRRTQFIREELSSDKAFVEAEADLRRRHL